jgi:hypothetical protein
MVDDYGVYIYHYTLYKILIKQLIHHYNLSKIILKTGNIRLSEIITRLLLEIIIRKSVNIRLCNVLVTNFIANHVNCLNILFWVYYYIDTIIL